MPGRALFYFFVGTLNMFMMPGDLKQHEFPESGRGLLF